MTRPVYNFLIARCGPLWKSLAAIACLCLLPGCQMSLKQPTQITSHQLLGPETAPIATVNGVDVSLRRFNRMYQARLSNLRMQDSRVEPAIAREMKFAVATQLIDELLIMQAAERQGLEVLSVEVNETIQKLAGTFPDAKSFRRYLASLPDGEEGLQETIRLRLLKEHLAGVDPNAPVSDDEARVFYEQHAEQFNIPAHLIVQDIVFLVPPEATPDREEAQKKKAEEVAEKARQAGVSFGALARRYSESPAAKAGGYAGRVTKETIDPALWAALQSMDPKQVSGAVRTIDGYHILKLIHRNPEMHRSLDQVRETIKTTIRMQRRSSRIGQLITSLRAEAKIENFLVDRYQKRLSPPLGVGRSSG